MAVLYHVTGSEVPRHEYAKPESKAHISKSTGSTICSVDFADLTVHGNPDEMVEFAQACLDAATKGKALEGSNNPIPSSFSTLAEPDVGLNNLKEHIFNFIEDNLETTIHKNGPEHKTLESVLEWIDQEIDDLKLEHFSKAESE